MIKSIIVTLLFVGGSVSSLSCRGSISIKNDMMSIDLQVTKSNTDDDFDRFIEKSQASNVKSRIYLQIDSGKRIEINSETDHKPNYGEVNFNEVTASQNITKANIVNDSINVREPVLKEQIYNISNSLRHVTSLMLQQLDTNKNDKKLYHNAMHNKDLHHYIDPRKNQKFTNFDKKIDNFASALEFSSNKLAFEKKRLSSELKILFEYVKSIQISLLWLIRLFKWQQLRNDFDDTLRLSLFSLQKQAEFLLEILIKDNGRQRKESKKYLPTDRSESNLETIKLEKVAILRKKKNEEKNKKANVKKITDNEAVLTTESSILVFSKSSQNENKIINATEIKTEATILKNLYNNKLDEITSENEETRASFEEIHTETQKINESRTSDHTHTQISYKPETRIFNYPILENITDRFKNKNFTAIEMNSVKNHSNSIINEISIRNNSVTNIFLSKIKNFNKKMFPKSKETSHGESIEMENRKNLFEQLENSSTLLSGKSMTDTLEKIDTQKQIRMETLLHKSTKESTTNIPDIEVLISSNKSENQHASRKKIVDNYHYSHEEVRTNIDSTIDELLEAVNEVLPSEKSMERLPMRLKMISGIS